MSTLFWLLFLTLYASYILLVGPLSFWLLFNAQTAVGNMLATMGIVSLLLPALVAARLVKPQKAVSRLLGITIVLLVGLATAVLLSTPSGKPNPNSPVQHRYFREEGYGRFNLTSIVPESEQVNLGFTLMPYVDPLLTVEQSRRVSQFTMALYREMESDPNFHELGSAMNLAYDELVGRPFDAGHYYLYIPQNAPSDPLPAIVFLHGSAGNFKAYTWVWSKLAEAKGYIIIAPSYGFGNWDEAGAATVFEAIADAKQQVAIDEEHLYLAGLSNGGLGVSQLAAAQPDLFRGLIFLSPVMNDTRFLSHWTNRPILLISGEADKRIPLSYIQQHAASLEQANVNLTTIIYPNEDHFLVFSQPESIMHNVTIWLEETQ